MELYDDKDINLVDLLSSMKVLIVEDQLLDIKCSGQLQPDTFPKEFSYSTGD